ncbi:hypothetical protein JVU11DRAFT_7247 [Chiua virens]|nr:hypothetical protein JVU11DRAFT_7247 [Chiua virens]
MSLSLKAELETWVSALKAYDEQDFEQALQSFSLMADSSKILTNMGLIYATIGDHETAVEHFIAATNLDSYLAIAHFQCGVSNFLLERYDLALLNFEDAYLFLRGNEAMYVPIPSFCTRPDRHPSNYEQIGLKFTLFCAEILFNKGLAELSLGYAQEGMTDMQEASRQKVTEEHNVIDEAIRERGQGYTVFSIPVGVLYRPSENKIKNSKSKDYLGKAKLVAASDSDDAFTEFTGVKRLQQASESDKEDKEDERNLDAEFSLSRSATVPAPRSSSVYRRISVHSHRVHPGTDPIIARRIALERSKTTLQVGATVRPDMAAILASRRSQSVSNPANVPSALNLLRSNTTLGRSNTTRLARSNTVNTNVMPLRVKTSQVPAAVVAGVGAGVPRDGGDIGAAVGGTPRMLRSQPSLRRLPEEVPPVTQQSSIPRPLQALPQVLQPGQYVNPSQEATPLVLPAMPPSAQEGGHDFACPSFIRLLACR